MNISLVRLETQNEARKCRMRMRPARWLWVWRRHSGVLSTPDPAQVQESPLRPVARRILCGQAQARTLDSPSAMNTKRSHDSWHTAPNGQCHVAATRWCGARLVGARLT